MRSRQAEGARRRVPAPFVFEAAPVLTWIKVGRCRVRIAVIARCSQVSSIERPATDRTPRGQNARCDGHRDAGSRGGQLRPHAPAALCRRGRRSSRSGPRATSAASNGGHGGHARHLLPDAVAPLGPRPVRARPGGAGRPRQPPLLLLLHRDLAAGVLLRRRPADHGRPRPVPVTSTLGRAWCGYTCPQTVWTDLFLVVERCDRGRPQRPHQARQRRRGPPRKIAQARRQAWRSGC